VLRFCHPEADVLCDSSHAGEFFRDVQADLRRRSATRSAKPKSLWEELAVRATLELPHDNFYVSLSAKSLVKREIQDC
jgi:hypothetical protein